MHIASTVLTAVLYSCGGREVKGPTGEAMDRARLNTDEDVSSACCVCCTSRLRLRTCSRHAGLASWRGQRHRRRRGGAHIDAQLHAIQLGSLKQPQSPEQTLSHTHTHTSLSSDLVCRTRAMISAATAQAGQEGSWGMGHNQLSSRGCEKQQARCTVGVEDHTHSDMRLLQVAKACSWQLLKGTAAGPHRN
jgi:hypothetical protein